MVPIIKRYDDWDYFMAEKKLKNKLDDSDDQQNIEEKLMKFK